MNAEVNTEIAAVAAAAGPVTLDAAPRIFVAIASYRDPECQWTVKDLFEAASRPERLQIGICWQFDAEKDQNCFTVPYPRPDQVRVTAVSPQDARGACWAKHQALALRGDEPYVLLIDSHMRFAPGWDDDLIAMLAGIGNPRAFLSTYPAGYVPPNERRYNTPRLTPVKYFQRVMSQDSVLLDMAEPMPSHLMAGGYLFGPAALFDEVPYDPHIYFIGEEIAHAARYYTHGWDGYTPHKCLVHHYYARTDAPKHWGDQKEAWARLNVASYKRVRHLLGVERTADPTALQDIDRYGLGSRRSLVDFQAVIGANFNATLIDRSRHLSIEAIRKASERPKMPLSTHEMSQLTLHACRHGWMLVPKLDAYIGRSLLKYGEWTEGVTEVLAAIVPAGSHVVEVGAGFGARTLPLARMAGCEGRVTAIEQSRRLVRLLHANAALNAIDHVHVVACRTGAMPGAVFVDEPNFDAAGNFGLIGHRPLTDPAQTATLEVPLDQQALGEVQVLVIDTPGQVSGVLHGAAQLIRSQGPVVVLNADNAVDAAVATRWLAERGYRIWRHRSPFYRADNIQQDCENVFAGVAALLVIALRTDQDLYHLGAERHQ